MEKSKALRESKSSWFRQKVKGSHEPFIFCRVFRTCIGAEPRLSNGKASLRLGIIQPFFMPCI